jgi:PqqD family protein of HPr-rel-A system
MKQETAQRWQTVPHLRLRWRCWGEEHIAYNCNSGDTHLLNPVAAEALKVLYRTAVSVDELEREVGRCLNLENGEVLNQNLHQFVLKLARLGLICPADESR